MKRCLLSSVLVITSVCLSGQFTYFNNLYNNDYVSGASSITETDYGYVISGWSVVVGNDSSYTRLVLTAIDDQGNQLWWKTYGENYRDYYTGYSRSIDRTYDGGFIIGGWIEDEIRNVGLLIKFDQNGDSLWSRIYGDTASSYWTSTTFLTCRELPDHNIILIGSAYISVYDSDIKIIKTDPLGNVIWQHIYGDFDIWENAYSFAQLPDGGFIIGIEKTDFNSVYPGILKIDSLGNKLWMKYFGSSVNEWGCYVTVSRDGNYLIGTTYDYQEPGSQNPLHKARIIKTDTAGNINWDKRYGNPYFSGYSCTIDELPDSGIIVSGQGMFQDDHINQGWIIKVGPGGDSIWMRRYEYNSGNTDYSCSIGDINITSDNGIILTGGMSGVPEYKASVWVQKLDSIGCGFAGCDPTFGIPQDDPPGFNKSNVSVCPNPASDWIHVLFQDHGINLFSDKEMEIYNAFGEKVDDVKLPRWTETYNYNVSSFSAGIYLILIKERQRVVYNGKILIAR